MDDKKSTDLKNIINGDTEVDIKLSDAEYKELVVGLNELVSSSSEILENEYNEYKESQSSIDESFPNNSVIEEEGDNTYNLADSESAKLLEALPIYKGDKGVLTAIQEYGLLSKFDSSNSGLSGLSHSVWGTDELLKTILKEYGVSTISKDGDNIDDGNVFMFKDGVFSVNYSKLSYHTGKLYDK
jgi:hypothetical protein